jgi:hypothetical protein
MSGWPPNRNWSGTSQASSWARCRRWARCWAHRCTSISRCSSTKPWSSPPGARPRAIPGGFTIDGFTIDDQAATVTCPAGHTAALGRPQADGNRQAHFKAWCPGCPLRERCTTSKTGRVLTVHPQHALLAAARRAAADPAWQDEYRRWRPPVERAIAWLVAHGNRRVPYRGITKNNTWLHHRAAALNLRRLVSLGLTRTSTGAWALA